MYVFQGPQLFSVVSMLSKLYCSNFFHSSCCLAGRWRAGITVPSHIRMRRNRNFKAYLPNHVFFSYMYTAFVMFDWKVLARQVLGYSLAPRTFKDCCIIYHFFLIAPVEFSMLHPPVPQRTFESVLYQTKSLSSQGEMSKMLEEGGEGQVNRKRSSYLFTQYITPLSVV